MATTDIDLLQKYVQDNSQEAFAELVGAHLNLVYSAALRQVRSPELAQEVSQSVFTDLSQNAARLKPDTILASWLYQVTRRTAVDAIRRESRRQAREQIAFELSEMNTNAQSWVQVEPLLDEAMEALEETDRSAILLRYFENKSLREVGQALGVTDDTAQKRVGRAVDRLREFFSKRDVAMGATALVALVSTHAVQAAPVGLQASIATTVTLSTAALQNSTTIGITKAITMTTLQKSVIAATLAVAVGTGIYEARQVSQLKKAMAALQQQQQPLNEQIQQLNQQREQANASLIGLREENEQLRRNSSDLFKLRGEVKGLRDSARELGQLKAALSTSSGESAFEATVKSWVTRATQLKERLDQMPEKNIPELQFLTDKDWIDAVKHSEQMESDADFRRALSQLRSSGKNAFGSMLREAIKKYAAANDGELPPNISGLKSYFETPLEDSLLQRYATLQTGKLAAVPRDAIVVTEMASTVDEDYDTFYQFKMNGTRSSSLDRNTGALLDAAREYVKANPGQLPKDSTQIAVYLKRPVEAAIMEKFVTQIPDWFSLK